MENVLIALLSLVGGAAMGQVLGAHLAKQREETKQAAASKFLALRLAFVFEAVAIECSRILSKNESDDDMTPHEGPHFGPMPSAPTLPESDAYQSIDIDLLARILSFPQELSMASESHSAMWMVADDDDTAEVVHEDLARFGLAALAIASEMRSKYELGSRDVGHGGWNVRHHLETKQTAIRASKEKRRQAYVDFTTPAATDQG